LASPKFSRSKNSLGQKILGQNFSWSKFQGNISGPIRPTLARALGTSIAATLYRIGLRHLRLLPAFSQEHPLHERPATFDTRIYLFHEQKLLSEYSVRLYLEREGIERYVHAVALDYPTLYGVSVVVLATAAGLLAARLSGGERLK
jgi:hypothetical protein